MSGQSTLMRATKPNRDAMKSFIGAIRASSQTNYEAALDKAFKVLKASKDAGQMSGCHGGAVLFLSDGAASQGAKGDELAEKVKGWNGDDFAFTIFTYGFGDDVTGDNAPELKKLACESSGMFFQIGDDESDKLKGKMAQYYGLLAATRPAEKPVWSETYASASTGLELITAGMPVYDKTKSPKELFGVIALDVIADSSGFGAFADSTTVLASMHAATKAQCSPAPTFTLTDAQMEALRDTYGAQNCTDPNDAGADAAIVVIIVVCVLGGVCVAVIGVCKLKARRQQSHAVSRVAAGGALATPAPSGGGGGTQVVVVGGGGGGGGAQAGMMMQQQALHNQAMMHQNMQANTNMQQQQRLDAERQRLELERQKFELEKQQHAHRQTMQQSLQQPVAQAYPVGYNS